MNCTRRNGGHLLADARSSYGELRRQCGLAVAALFLVGVCLSSARAQIGRQPVPNNEYIFAKAAFNEGEYRDAAKSFLAAARRGVHTTDGVWADSVCYYAMLGECYYQQGNMPQAFEQYNAALRVLVDNGGWMLRVEFPGVINPANINSRDLPTWGAGARPVRPGRFTDSFSAIRGRFDNLRVLQQGGVLAPLELVPVRVSEIVNCIALALRRRRELMGPAGKHSEFSADIVNVLSQRSVPKNSWAQSWVSVLLGLAHAGAGQPKQAVGELNRGLLAAGQYDHPLTAVALLEMGKLAFEAGRLDNARAAFLNASLVAAAFAQPDILEESLRYGSTTHLATQNASIYPPLELAIAWVGRQRQYRHLRASLLVLAAENHSLQGSPQRALALLSEAQRALGRKGLSTSRVAARYQHQIAFVNFQTGNGAAAQRALASMLAFQRNGSRKLFQIRLADSLLLGKQVSPRVAELIFAEVLREPQTKDWMLEPLETLSVVLAPHIGALTHWMELALDRKNKEQALEISDRIRRARFYASLPLGGRLLAFRWLLEAPADVLNDKTLLERQALHVKYPGYVAMSQAARQARAELRKLPWPVEEDKEVAKQKRLLMQQLSNLSDQQELTIHAIALRREPSTFLFPPQRKAAELQEALPADQLVLSYMQSGASLLVFAYSRDELEVWRIAQLPKLRSQISSFLRSIGNQGANQAISPKQLDDESWKAASAELLDALSKKAPPEFWDRFKEVVIVPEGVLWYLPFEALQVRQGAGSKAFGDRLKIRYAPTCSLAAPSTQPLRKNGVTWVVAGKLYPAGDHQEELAQETFQRLNSVMPEARKRVKLLASSRVESALCDRLLVLDDIENGGRGVYDWSPFQLDQGKPDSNLASWMLLPWAIPAEIVLPGRHSAAEERLKANATGHEVFLTACGLMSAGARTILLSRWRTGGQTSHDLSREFLQELPYAPAADAWQRSVQLVRESPLDPDVEPRLKGVSHDAEILADHPFFWAGYLLVSDGASHQRRVIEKKKTDGAPKKKP